MEKRTVSNPGLKRREEPRLDLLDGDRRSFSAGRAVLFGGLLAVGALPFVGMVFVLISSWLNHG